MNSDTGSLSYTITYSIPPGTTTVQKSATIKCDRVLTPSSQNLCYEFWIGDTLIASFPKERVITVLQNEN